MLSMFNRINNTVSEVAEADGGQVLVDANVGVDRRTALKLLTVFGASLMEACRGCDKDKAPKDIVELPAPTPSPVPEQKLEMCKPEKILTPELPHDDGVKLPNFSFQTMSWPLDKPVEYPGSDEEFKQDAAEIAYSLSDALQRFMLPELNHNPANRDRIILDTVGHIATNMGTNNERMRVAMNRLHANLGPGQTRPEPVVEEINKYLHVAGLHLALHIGMRGAPSMELFDIENVGYATTKLDGEFYKLPVLTMDKDKLGGAASLNGSTTLASCNTTFDYMMIYKDKFENSLDQVQATFGFSSEDRQDMAAALLQHEATHLYLAKRFPTAGKMVEEGKGFKVPVSIPAKVVKVDMDMRIMPAGFHELAGFGVQIAKGKKSSRFQLIHYLRHRMSGTYALVSQFMPLAIMGVAKDSPLKASIGNKFYDRNTNTFGDVGGDELVELVAGFSDEECAQVGESLYQMAYHFMRRMEAGEFEEASL